ncbi:hypothetical protein NKG94_17525 [Micromonospora sp. M12]
MVALYVVNGFRIGWQQAYDVTIGITSPGEVASAYLAWPSRWPDGSSGRPSPVRSRAGS